MRNLSPIVIAVVLFLLLTSCLPGRAQTIAFQRDDGIWISDITGRGQRFLCRGYDPEISPDGRHVAFTHYEDAGPTAAPDRSIAICDIASRDIEVMRSMPGSTHFGPAWSPRGDWIAVSSYVNGVWGVGIVRRDGTSYRLLTGGLQRDTYSPTWNHRGDRILCHGDGFLYTLDEKGGVRDRVPCRDIAGDYGMTSATSFRLSRDGRCLLFDADVPNETMAGLNEPPGALFVHDLSSGKTERITPRGICGFYPTWYPGGKVLFSGFGEGDMPKGEGPARITVHLYTIDVSGGNLQVFIEDARDASLSSLVGSGLTH